MANTPRSEGWSTPIEQAMKRNVVCYDEQTPALVVYDFLCRVSIRRIVVVRDDRPVGVISRGSLLRWFGNWQIAGVTARAYDDWSSAQERIDAMKLRLAHTSGGIAEHVSLLREHLELRPESVTAAVVAQATRIQELANDLLACTQHHYEFAPGESLACTD
jgi:signal-transduction protein with cAMP-binding, CBS, and nucleotidyltransferase domain